MTRILGGSRLRLILRGNAILRFFVFSIVGPYDFFSLAPRSFVAVTSSNGNNPGRYICKPMTARLQMTSLARAYSCRHRWASEFGCRPPEIRKVLLIISTQSPRRDAIQLYLLALKTRIALPIVLNATLQRKNLSRTFSRRCSGTPGPSSSTAT